MLENIKENVSEFLTKDRKSDVAGAIVLGTIGLIFTGLNAACGVIVKDMTTKKLKEKEAK